MAGWRMLVAAWRMLGQENGSNTTLMGYGQNYGFGTISHEIQDLSQKQNISVKIICFITK